MRSPALGHIAGVDLAKILGISVDRLATLTVRFATGEVVTVLAEYHISEEQMTKVYELLQAKETIAVERLLT